MANHRNTKDSTIAQSTSPAIRNRWLVFVLPFAVYMLLGALEPGPQGARVAWLAIPFAYYPAVYTLKIVATVGAMLFVLPGYRQFPFRVSPMSILVGVLGAALWIGLCEMQLERQWLQPSLERLLEPVGLQGWASLGVRTAYDPFRAISTLWAAWLFLAVRLFGLAVVVPVIEEFFLRGFLMRYAVKETWWEVPIGAISRLALVVMLVYAVATHPAELLAAVAWFSLVTWWVARTKNLWDGVAVHAMTNLLLGLYAAGFGRWHLL